ncbi:ADP-ribose pyrophosphatase [Anaerolineales bacterium]
MKEKIISSKSIYEGRIVHLSVATVQLPNGQQSTREIVKHPGAVAIVALTESQQILMVKQFRLAANQVMLELPAGTLEPDEDPLQCAIRELQEETGYKPGSIEPMGGVFVAPGYTTEFIHFFLATNLVESVLEMDDDEFIELIAIDYQQVLAMIESHKIQDAKTIAAILKVAHKFGW